MLDTSKLSNNNMPFSSTIRLGRSICIEQYFLYDHWELKATIR